MQTVDLFSSTHPLAPPTREETVVAWLRLIRSRRVGPATFYRLMGEHGSAAAALDALPDVAKAAGVTKYASWSEEAAQDELKAGRAIGAKLLFRGGPDYPADLAELSDAPPILWALGDTSLLNRPLISVVGARNASSLGTRMARRLATDLADRGFVTVSGMARGIDACVHQASLETGTIAVLAGGVDTIYPLENTDLYHQLAKSGLILSEQPIGLHPQSRHFPQRNRIISGLSKGTLVIEASARSGSLITARNAADQGREVLAVPGHPFDARSWGCNALLRDGATLVRDADDVVQALGPLAAPAPETTKAASSSTPVVPDGPPEKRRTLAEATALHTQILDRLGPTPLAEDQLIRDLKIPSAQVSSELLTLEMTGQVIRQPGGLLSRNDT